MKPTACLIVAAIVALLGGCRVYGTARVAVPPPPTVTVEADVAAPPPPTATVTIQASQPEVSAGVVVMTPSCTPGAPEVLNGVDDNCNGVVDEGFVQTGAVQISLGWATGADMDLYVVDPFNEEVSYRNRTVSSSGHLDRDARGACTDGQTTENVYWPAGQAPRGTYQVAVHYFSGCNAAGPTPVTLSIMVGGRALGVYQYTIGEGQRVTMATFTIP